MKALILGKGTSGKAAARLVEAKGGETTFVDGYDLVVASPGMRVISELQFGCEELKRRGWKLLAVTGSKGKSSVVKLVAEAVKGIPCGNYGRPVSDLFDEPVGWAVVEVSSFQLETTTLAPDTFEAAAILNLQEDHLDRHGGVETYHALKKKLATFAKIAVIEPMVDEAEKALFAGTYFDNKVLEGNASAAISLMRSAGLDNEKIAKAFAGFEPLRHRFEVVHEENGVRYIDDSKATSLAAMAAGVKMCKGSVRLIAGGKPKGDDPGLVVPTLTKGVKKVYLIGQSAKLFLLSWEKVVDCEICETLEKAVEMVKREAVKGETVLLSPGTASYDQFKNFEERGDRFADLVKKGKTEE